MNYKLPVKKPHTAILIKLISLASIGATLFTPGIPQIRRFFQISEGTAQSALTLFLVGYAIGQIIYSPFANRFGRKPMIYTGLFVAMIGSLFSALSGVFDSFTLLVVSRFVTAIGAGAGLVIAMTIINDYYYEHQARKVVPIVTSAFAVIPFLGVAIGGILVHHFGWESSFYFLLLYYVVAFIFSMRLPETGTNLSRKETQRKVIFSRYKQAFQDRRLVLFSILFGMTTAMIFVFAASAPLISVDVFGINPQNYGFINLLVALAYFSGNLAAATLRNRFSSLQMMAGGLVIFGVSFLFLILFFLFEKMTAWAFFVPFIISNFGYPLAFSNAIVLGSNHYEDKATGSAVMNFINIGIATLGVILVQTIPVALTFSVPLLMVLLSVLYVFIFIYAKRLVR